MQCYGNWPLNLDQQYLSSDGTGSNDDSGRSSTLSPTQIGSGGDDTLRGWVAWQGLPEQVNGIAIGDPQMQQSIGPYTTGVGVGDYSLMGKTNRSLMPGTYTALDPNIALDQSIGLGQDIGLAQSSTLQPPEFKSAIARRRRAGMKYTKNPCVECKASKRKCDDKVPCTPCVTRGLENMCVKSEKPKRDVKKGQKGGRKVKSRDPLTFYADTSRQLSNRYERHSLLKLFSEELVPASMPWLVNVRSMVLDAHVQYEMQWWNDDKKQVDPLLESCSAVYAAISLSSLGNDELAYECMGFALPGLAQATGKENILPKIVATIYATMFFLCDDSERCHQQSMNAQAWAEQLTEEDISEDQKEKMLWIAKNLQTLALPSPKILQRETQTEMKGGRTWAAENIHAECEKELASRSDIMAAIIAGSTHLTFFVNKGILMLFGGRIISRVDTMLRKVSKSPVVTRFGILKSMELPVNVEPLPESERNGLDPDAALASMAALMSLLKKCYDASQAKDLGGSHIYDRETRLQCRAMLNQLMYSCRTLTIVVLWWSGSSQLALQCAREFASNTTHDFNLGNVGSYTLAPALLLEIALDAKDLTIAEGIKQHLEKRLRSGGIYPDSRKHDLVTVADMVIQAISG